MEVSKSITITRDIVEEFARLSGDFNPLHLDEEFAKNSIFGRCIVHGMLLSSYFSTLIAQDYPGPGSVYLNQTLNFISPCYIGDIVKVVVSLDKKDKNKYYLNTTIYDSYGNILIEGTALVLKK